MPRRRRPWAAAVFAAAVLSLAPSVRGHDTWLVPQPPGERGERVFALGTGERFPKHDAALEMAQLAALGCRAPLAPQAAPVALRWLADGGDALLLRSTRALPADLLLDCRVQTRAATIALDDAQVAAYFDEARPGEDVLARWLRLRAQGRGWQERFRKNARIVDGTTPWAEALLLPATMDLDAELRLPHWPLRPGDTVSLRLLADGQPLPHQPVELLGDLLPRGLWLRSDEAGRLSLTLPRPGRWLLRSVQITPAADGSSSWDSRFFSLHLEVQAR